MAAEPEVMADELRKSQAENARLVAQIAALTGGEQAPSPQMPVEDDAFARLYPSPPEPSASGSGELSAPAPAEDAAAVQAAAARRSAAEAAAAAAAQPAAAEEDERRAGLIDQLRRVEAAAASGGGAAAERRGPVVALGEFGYDRQAATEEAAALLATMRRD